MTGEHAGERRAGELRALVGVEDVRLAVASESILRLDAECGLKRRTNEMGALAGFEKSGHFFFNKPFGRGYEDGLVSAIAICDMLAAQFCDPAVF
ncbi:hypothetical protein ACVWZK_009402 [Bradyrhizobium sp. GM0.4]